MGNEQSTPKSPGQQEVEDRELEDDLDAADAVRADAKNKYKAKYLQEYAANASEAAEQSLLHADASRNARNGAIAPQRALDHLPGAQPTAADNAASSSQVPTRSKEPSRASDDPLKAFHPRKHRHEKSTIEHFSPPPESSRLPLTGTTRPASATDRKAEEKTPSVSKLPKIAKRTSIASPQSPEQNEDGPRSPNNLDRAPQWYQELPQQNARNKKQSSTDILLSALRDHITKGQKTAQNGASTPVINEQIRIRLHNLVFTEVTGQLLKNNRMLHNADGLPQLFDTRFSKGITWPFDIQTDAKELYNKWYREVFDTDLLRGINIKVKSAAHRANTDDERVVSGGDSIEASHKRRADFYGNGDLLNGQWWPTLLCAVRDGAHGATVAGISGKAGKGAYSVLMASGGGYDDVDNGDEVLYCGTDGVGGSITGYTRLLLESVQNRRPVRLLRSSKLASQFAPRLGFRYDGLYDVVSYKNLDGPSSLRQRHRFRLLRQAKQDPIRGGDGPESRPTAQEEAQYKQHRRFAGRDKAQE